MNAVKSSATLLLAVVVLLAGCVEEEPISNGGSPAVHRIETPAGPGSLTPSLHVSPAGELYLSWQERLAGSRMALRFAVRKGGRWSTPRTIAAGADWFVNWADFPSLTTLGGGTLAAHFLQKTGGAPYAYAVRIIRSTDSGATWSAPITPHRDGTPTEHGFVSLISGPDGRLGVVWLDGRQFAKGKEEMMLRFAAITPSGAISETAVLDRRTCECCKTDAARTARGLVVAYRNRTKDEIRDIAIVRRVDGQWTEPVRLHADGWKIAGCPVNGPALDAADRRVAVAWFTRAGGQPRVKVAFSDDGGASFSAPVRMDSGQPLGRVDVALLEGGEALVSWMARADTSAVLRARIVTPEGWRAPPVTIASLAAARASGFPQLAVRQDSAYFAWTDPGEPSRIRMAVAHTDAFLDGGKG